MTSAPVVITGRSPLRSLDLLFLGGAEEIRTPDPLHAMEAWAVVRQGQASPDVATTCCNCGWTQPGVGGCRTMLAPNLAPSKSLAALMFE